MRQYPLPAVISSAVLGSAPTMDDIDRLLESGGGGEAERVWAARVRQTFVGHMLDKVCGDDDRLPSGVIASVSDDTDVIVALIRDDQMWTPNGWEDFDDLIDFNDVILLTPEEVAFTADAMSQGAVGLALRATQPLAFVDKTVTAAADAQSPAGAKVIAVVDELDHAAVLDLLAIAPGPVVFRRHDGQWVQDDAWIHELRSIKPPVVITVEPERVDSVAAQVDESTTGQKYEGSSSLRGSGPLEEREAEMWIEWALVASNAPTMTAVMASQMPAKLQKYWLTGRGAAKIRWFTPGSWRRCRRQLSKYMPPNIAAGACTNLSQKLGGQGVATHVG